MKNPIAKDLRTPKYRPKIKPDGRAAPQQRKSLVEMHEFRDKNGDDLYLITAPKAWLEFAKLLRQRYRPADK